MTRLFDGGVTLKVAVLPLRRCEWRNVGGGEVGAGAVQTCGVAPSAAGATGDVDADFDHDLGLHERDRQGFSAAPACEERPARPWVPRGGRCEEARDRRAGGLGEGGGAAALYRRRPALS